MKRTLNLIMTLALTLTTWSLQAAINPDIVEVDLDIDYLATDDPAEWTPGGFVCVEGRRKITLQKVQPADWGTTAGDSTKRVRLSWGSTNIAIYTAATGGDEVISGTDYENANLPTNFWVEGVSVSATAGTSSAPGPETILAQAIPDGMYDRVAFTVINIDLDVDSDNDNGFVAPDRNTVEDDIEDDATKLGKCLGVNNDDSDGDGVPDFADGFDWDGVAGNADDISTKDEFVQLVLEVSSPVDLTASSIRLTYSASDPSGVSTSCTPTVWSTASGHLRIWKKIGDQSRNKASCDASSPGDYVPPQVYSDLSKLGLSESTRTVTLYVEGITNSSTIGDQQIMVELDPDGSGGVAGWTALDAVRMTVVKVDITAIWPESNGGAGYEVHEAIEEDSYCWQMLVNDEDDNLDDVPDMDRTCLALDSGDSNIATVRLAVKPLPDLGRVSLELDDATAVRLYNASGATRLHDPSASGGGGIPFLLDLAAPVSSSPLAPLLTGAVEFRIEGVAVNTNLTYSLKYTIGTAVIAIDIARQSIGKESMLGDLGYGEVSSGGSEEQNSANTSESVGIASVSPSAASSVNSIGSGTILRNISKDGGQRYLAIPPDPYDFKIYFVASHEKWTTFSNGKLRNASIELKHSGSPAAIMSLIRLKDSTDGTTSTLPALLTHYNDLLNQQNAAWENSTSLLPNEAALRAMLATIGITASDISKGNYWYTPAKVDDTWIQKSGTVFKYSAKINIPSGTVTPDVGDQEVQIFRLDADVDSNNDGTVDTDNTKEDRYEYDGYSVANSPGQVVEVNNEAVIDIRENELPAKGTVAVCVSSTSSASGIELYKGTDTTPLTLTPGTTISIPYGPGSGGGACPPQFRVKANKPGRVLVLFGYQSFATGTYLWDIEAVSVYFRDPISRSPYSRNAKGWCPYAWGVSPENVALRRIENSTVPVIMGAPMMGLDSFLVAESYNNVDVYQATSPGDDAECTADRFLKLCNAGVLVIQTHGNANEFVVKAFNSEGQRTQWASACPELQPTEPGVAWKMDVVFPCITVSAAWLATHWKPTLDANEAIVVVNSCHSATTPSGGGASIIASIGGRVRFGWDGLSDASLHRQATFLLLGRLVGQNDAGTKRTVQYAYNLCQSEYDALTSANPQTTGKWKHSWDSADDVWTTVCPAPTKTFPASISGSFDMPRQWGCLISDTYLDSTVGSADDSVTQYSGATGVLQQRAWLPSPVVDATKVSMIGFEYKGHDAPFKARAVRAKCVNYVTAAGERRSMDMDGVRPNNDKDLLWPPPSLAP